MKCNNAIKIAYENAHLQKEMNDTIIIFFGSGQKDGLNPRN